jgi:superfamily II DNA/RNA helicase
MVATDIAARGIDVTRISHVINYDMPSTADAYTHRIGRTGRASKTGDAFTFVTGDDLALALSLKRILGEKLQYQNVDGLTSEIQNSSAKKNAPDMKSDNRRRSFTRPSQTRRKPKQRSFQNANRSSWSHRSPSAS